MIVQIAKVNVYMIPLFGGDHRLVLDRGTVVINTDKSACGGHVCVTVKDRENPEITWLTMLVSLILQKKKNVVHDLQSPGFVKGQTRVDLRTAVYVGTQASKTLIFRMELQDHRIFNDILDSSLAS